MKIVIIGSGICGCTIARELSRHCAEIVVLDKDNDVSMGASKANSGIVHTGFDALPNTKKAKYNVLGAKMMEQLASELCFPYEKNGSMVLSFEGDSEDGLNELYQRGLENGVSDLEVLTADEVRAIEPNVSSKVLGALYSKTSAIVSPYEMTIAFAENAYVNGVNFMFNKCVVDIRRESEGFTLICQDKTVIKADVVVNCAGVYADEINNLVCEKKLKINARKGDYVVLDKDCGHLCRNTLFQLPNKMGKGVLVAPTTSGNIIVGPTATGVEDKDFTATQMDELELLFERGQKTMPALQKRTIITQYSGLRAHEQGGDFVIEESEDGFFNVAGIESPGLTAAPAIAVDIANEIAQKYGLQKNEGFDGHREGIVKFSTLSRVQQRELIEQNPLYGNVVCRCEMVTEAEIVDSINRPLGATCVDGVKRRTRAGMGRCQSGFCSPKIMEILSRERGVDMTSVTKSGKNSQVVIGRTK